MEITFSSEQDDEHVFFVTASSLNPDNIKCRSLKGVLHEGSSGLCANPVPVITRTALDGGRLLDKEITNTKTLSHTQADMPHCVDMGDNFCEITHHALTHQTSLEEIVHNRNTSNHHSDCLGNEYNDSSTFDDLLLDPKRSKFDKNSSCNMMDIHVVDPTPGRRTDDMTSASCNSGNAQPCNGIEISSLLSTSLSQSQLVSNVIGSSLEKNGSLENLLLVGDINSHGDNANQSLKSRNSNQSISAANGEQAQSLVLITNQSKDAVSQEIVSDPKALHHVAFGLNERETSELCEFGHYNNNSESFAHRHTALEETPLITPVTSTSSQSDTILCQFEKKPDKEHEKLWYNSPENTCNSLQSEKNRHIGSQQDEVDTVFLKSCKCKICQQSFNDVFNLNFHIFKVHEKTTHPVCMRCSTKFVSLHSLLCHLKRHRRKLLSKQTPNVPEEETRVFLSPPIHDSTSIALTFETERESLPIQERGTRLLQQVTENSSTFQCGECGNEYRHKKTLMHHVRSKHYGHPKKMRKCSHCSRSFASLWQLRNHMAWRHFGRKPYGCQFCQERFVCLPTLRRHQRKLHTGERPYGCSGCGERFFEKVALDLHKAQTHTGVFPFICSQCGRGFVQRCFLKNHLKIHSGLRPYCCPDCGKQYSKISHLKRHKIACVKKNADHKKVSQHK